MGRRPALIAAAFALCASGAAGGAAAQSGQQKNSRPPRPTESRPGPTPAATPAPKKAATRPEAGRGKEGGGAEGTIVAAPAAAVPVKADPEAAAYVYEFRQPDFVVHTIRIEHDDAGRGRIRFERRGDVEQLTEPFQLSPAALERLNARWSALEYLGSAESYQAPRDHSNLGKIRLSVRRGGRERAAEFNYSDNPDAQALADEYRRAAEQSILVFELNVALEAQPLETPKLINKIESLIKSKFLSDPRQLAPLLRQLAEDERVPLVGRNQAERILKKLEK